MVGTEDEPEKRLGSLIQLRVVSAVVNGMATISCSLSPFLSLVIPISSLSAE